MLRDAGNRIQVCFVQDKHPPFCFMAPAPSNLTNSDPTKGKANSILLITVLQEPMLAPSLQSCTPQKGLTKHCEGSPFTWQTGVRCPGSREPKLTDSWGAEMSISNKLDHGEKSLERGDSPSKPIQNHETLVGSQLAQLVQPI